MKSAVASSEGRRVEEPQDFFFGSFNNMKNGHQVAFFATRPTRSEKFKSRTRISAKAFRIIASRSACCCSQASILFFFGKIKLWNAFAVLQKEFFTEFYLVLGFLVLAVRE